MHFFMQPKGLEHHRVVVLQMALRVFWLTCVQHTQQYCHQNNFFECRYICTTTRCVCEQKNGVRRRCIKHAMRRIVEEQCVVNDKKCENDWNFPRETITFTIQCNTKRHFIYILFGNNRQRSASLLLSNWAAKETENGNDMEQKNKKSRLTTPNCVVTQAQRSCHFFVCQ